jgi:CHAD domain-containing protein
MGGRDTTAGEMLGAVIADLVARIEVSTPAALADEPDAVHQVRTVVRRLRNVLAAFSRYVEPSEVGGLRARLTEYSDRLGRARDLEVRVAWCARIAAEVGLADDLRERLVVPLVEQHARAHSSLVAWFGSADAGPIGTGLGEATFSSTSAVGSARPAAVVAQEVLTEQVDRVLDHGKGYQDDHEAAHALRRAARRLRHTAEAVTRPPAEELGPAAAALGELGSRVQSLLGDHRDALLLAEHVRALLPQDAAERAADASVIEAAERAASAAMAEVPGVLAELRARRLSG